MKQRAPAVWEWVARLWSTRPGQLTGDWLQGVPEDWGPWLDDIGAAYLPYLCDNAHAVAAGHKRAALSGGGVTYPQARVSPYRVWCLEQLRCHYDSLPGPAQKAVRERLQRHACWEPLWRCSDFDSGVNRGVEPPFYCSDKMVG